jgi:uncharacterized protein YkwD
MGVPKISRVWLVAVVTGLLLSVAPTPSQAVNPARLVERTSMFKATNQSRLTHDVHGLWLNKEMSDLARRHSRWMARHACLCHTATPSAYYLKGVSWHTWGENIGVTYPGSSVTQIQRLEQGFMASAPHRANILNGKFKRTAIGTALDVHGNLWVTVFFYG